MEYSSKFEKMTPNSGRLKVHGGWIFWHGQKHEPNMITESMVFVPDPNHEWVIK